MVSTRRESYRNGLDRRIPGQPNQGDRAGARRNLVDAIRLLDFMETTEAKTLRARVLAKRALREAHADIDLEKAGASVATALDLLGTVPHPFSIGSVLMHHLMASQPCYFTGRTLSTPNQ